MPHTLAIMLREQVLPSVEQLKLENLILRDEQGKKAFGPYPPSGRMSRELALADGENLPGQGQIYVYEGHAILELAFVVQGRAELALAGQRYVMTSGDVAIVVPHALHLERIQNRNQGYHLLWLRVAPDRMSFHASSYSQGNRFQLVGGASIPRCGAIGRCFEAAAQESIERGPLWFDIVRARITEGLVLAIRHIETDGPGQNSSEARQSAVDVAKAFIHSHFSEDLSLELIAGQVYLSPNYFSSLFTQVSGRTVFEYVHEVRIDEAKRLLAETDIPIRQLAKRVGIPSPSYFCRLFRKSVRLAAKDYRAKSQRRRRN